MNTCLTHPQCTRRVLHAGNVMCWLCYQKINYKQKLIEQRIHSEEVNS